MKERILERIADLPGHVGMYYKNLQTGEEIEYNENDSLDLHL